MENPIKMDDLGVHLFLETSIYKNPVTCGCFQKLWENRPNHPFVHRGLEPLFSPSILGYHYFWKHTCRLQWTTVSKTLRQMFRNDDNWISSKMFLLMLVVLFLWMFCILLTLWHAPMDYSFALFCLWSSGGKFQNFPKWKIWSLHVQGRTLPYSMPHPYAYNCAPDHTRSFLAPARPTENLPAEVLGE